MPDDAQSKPPPLDYQPVVSKSRKGMSPWLVFWVGFRVGVVWTVAYVLLLAIAHDMPDWVAVTVSPGQVAEGLAHHWHSIVVSASLVLVADGISYGLLALLGYAAYRGLRRWQEEKA